jgi:hypothetical protein
VLEREKGATWRRQPARRGNRRGREVKERELRRCFGLHAGAGKEVN